MGLRVKRFSSRRFDDRGFTLLELLVVVAVIGILGAVTIPYFRGYYCRCCAEAAVVDISGMMKEGKQKALTDYGDYAVIFDTAQGKISLVSGRGADGDWNTEDDPTVRSFRLSEKGGGLAFGHGGHGPVPVSGIADPPDGVSFQNNRMVCNERLTGSAGAVYICSQSGAAVAVTMNSDDFIYKLYRWSGRGWVRF